jgi:hypothetical protein
MAPTLERPDNRLTMVADVAVGPVAYFVITGDGPGILIAQVGDFGVKDKILSFNRCPEDSDFARFMDALLVVQG